VLETVAPPVGDGAARLGDEAGVTLTDVVVTGVLSVVVVVGMLTVGEGGSFGVVVGGGGGGLTGSVGTVTGGGGRGGTLGTLETEGTVVGKPIPGAAASAWLATKPNRSVNPRAAAAFMPY
jgi:hypothetical protein